MEVRALSGADREAILAGRYPGRYATYDVDDPAALDTDPVCWTLAMASHPSSRASRRVAAGHGFTVESVLPSDEGDFPVMVRDGVAVS